LAAILPTPEKLIPIANEEIKKIIRYELENRILKHLNFND